MLGKGRVGNLEELQRQALDTGAELVVDGKVFNAGRLRAEHRPARLPPPPAPPIAPEPPQIAPAGLSRDEVLSMIAERDQDWQGRLDRLYDQLLAITSIMAAQRPRPTWTAIPEYGSKGELLALTLNASTMEPVQ